MIIIGQNINASNKSVAEAIANRDETFLQASNLIITQFHPNFNVIPAEKKGVRSIFLL